MNKSLAMEMWKIFTMFILAIAVLLGLIYFIVLKSFFTDEVYQTIETAQQIFLKPIDRTENLESLLESYQIEELQNYRVVDHIFFTRDMASPNRHKREPKEFLFKRIYIANDEDLKAFSQTVKENIESQETLSKRYEWEINGKKLHYVITKLQKFDEEIYVLSFMWDTYKTFMVNSLSEKLILLVGFLSLAGIFLANILTKKITAPLMELEAVVEKISTKDWLVPPHLQRKDEIGRLANSINKMQEELRKQDKQQQTFLQTISHDLKTPVMVIQSYAQALSDRVYLNENYDETVKVIEKESNRLLRKIKQLLYLSGLEYINEKKVVTENVNLKALMENLITRFSFIRQDLNWSIKLINVEIMGDIEQLTVLFENILDNQMRYAKKTIRITFHIDSNNDLVINIYNDGNPIEETAINNIFKKFRKDKKGEFGLGLTIAKKIVDFHGGNISAHNQKDGVNFQIKLPITRS